jgi:hypothetical protein
MNCPTLSRYFSDTVSHYFDLFPLLIKKLTGGPHGDIVHGVTLLVVHNHFSSVSAGRMLRGSDATTALRAGAALHIRS